MLSFPIFDIQFDIHTDVGGYQLGGGLLQDQKLVAVFSIKSTDTQKMCTSTEN